MLRVHLGIMTCMDMQKRMACRVFLQGVSAQGARPCAFGTISRASRLGKSPSNLSFFGQFSLQQKWALATGKIVTIANESVATGLLQQFFNRCL